VILLGIRGGGLYRPDAHPSCLPSYRVRASLLTYCLGDAKEAHNGSSFRIVLQVAVSCAVLVAP